MEGEKKSFWATLPGILTAIAGILGSLVAILTIVFPSPPIDAPPQIEEFLSIPPEIIEGLESTLKWEISAKPDARATIDHNIGDVSLSGNLQVKPEKTTIYTLTVINNKGIKDTKTTTVFVNNGESSPQKPKEIAAISDKANVIVVDKMGLGDYTTISRAISEAAEGSKILIRKGVYDEGMRMEKPLEILGEGELDDVVIRASGGDALYFNAPIGKVSNLKLLQRSGEYHYAVNIASGSLEINRCDISSDSSACIVIHGNSYPKLRSNKIHDGKKCGILVNDSGEGLIENNEIYGNGYAGIEIKEGGNPIVRGNKIYYGKQNGILVDENGLGLIEDNKIYGNKCAGIQIMEGGYPTVRKNKINNNSYYAIWISDDSGGIFEDNDLRENQLGPWEVSENSRSIIQSGNIE